jgi:hypothetical protein
MPVKVFLRGRTALWYRCPAALQRATGVGGAEARVELGSGRGRGDRKNCLAISLNQLNPSFSV